MVQRHKEKKNMRNEEQKRLATVDFCRFMAIIVIMLCHLYYMGFEQTSPFYCGYIYVEFFFILSGYFTYSHFNKIHTNSIDDIFKNSISYTIKKFFSFFPYVIIAVSVLYIIQSIAVGFSKQYILDYIFDITLMKNRFWGQNVVVDTLWFLSALIYVMPFFCIICQVKIKNLVYLIAFYLPLMFYGRYDLLGFPSNMYRAISGLCLGILVYVFSSFLKTVQLGRFLKLVLTIIELSTQLLVLYMAYKNKLYERLAILCFVIALSIMLSQQSYMACIKCKIFNWLGKLSMVIYIIHIVVAKTISYFFYNISNQNKLVLYFGSTFLLAVVLYYLVERKIKKLSDIFMKHILKIDSKSSVGA